MNLYLGHNKIITNVYLEYKKQTKVIRKKRDSEGFEVAASVDKCPCIDLHPEV